MVKLKNPLISLDARGTLSKAISFVKRRTQKIAEKKPEILDVKSPAQLSWRHMYQKAIALWHALSAAEKQEWESLARPKHMTGFAWFVSQALKPNPGLYLPLQGGTMAGDIDMAKHRVLRLPAPSDVQEAIRLTELNTHIAVAAAHHARYTNGEADARIAIHAAIAAAHHARYTNGEADARIAIHAAIAAAHHARYTNGEADARIAIHAAIAAAHHARYTNGEAVTAMGAKADANPLHHDRYADAEADARIAIHAAIAAAHHARYTDGEADARIAIHAALPNVHHAPYTEGARVSHSAAQVIPRITITTLAFDTEIYDTDAIHDLIGDGTRLTCKTAGKYLVIAYASFAPSAVGRRQLRIYLNGVNYGETYRNNLGSDWITTMHFSLILPLGVNDFVEVKVYHEHTIALNILSIANRTPFFMMQRIG